MKKILIFSFCFSFITLQAQLILEADGLDNTYELITSKLAPNYNPIEVPDCGHSNFGRHIDEIFDSELNKNVFRFFIHTGEDDDRCINFDRQRNEIKTYNQSPDSLLAVEGEIVRYQWKFKLPDGFQSSPKFTHIHQLKAVGGDESSMPLITLTTRKNTPDELELRYAETTSATTLKEVDLAPFIGTWCEVTETVTFGESGTYDIEIKKIADNSVLFSYTNNSIRMWKTDAEFIRPKWGIYRSLIYQDDLRDEEVLFADFSIEEFPLILSTDNNIPTLDLQIFPNPTKNSLQVIGVNQELSYTISNASGKEILSGKTENNRTVSEITLTNLANGVYFISFYSKEGKATKRFVKK